MLPTGSQSDLSRALASLTCRVEVPEWYETLQAKNGTAQSPVRPDDRRRFARFHCLTPAVLECRGSLPALPRESTPFVVLCKDISRNGIAFLHEVQLFPEEEITLWLPLGKLTYSISRCRRHNERCYEIGAKAG